ncbi:hypothetical protein [Ruegeria sp.]
MIDQLLGNLDKLNKLPAWLVLLAGAMALARLTRPVEGEDSR